jgi:hypothetical protein
LIEFSSSFGTFSIPIKATLPEHLMEFPEVIDFGYSPIRETAKYTFTLSNIGELKSYFEWNIEEPFNISPSNGELAPGGSCQMVIEFTPKDAIVLEAVAVCSFGIKEEWERTKVVKAARVYGISKFSHLVCENQETEFDFDKVMVGTHSERRLILKNPSPVHANFKIKRTNKDADDCFSFSTVSGRIEAGSRMEISVLNLFM